MGLPYISTNAPFLRLSSPRIESLICCVIVCLTQAILTCNIATADDISGYQFRLFAVKNAKIITAPGQTLENGHILVRAGRITAVGANVEIPGDAEIIDGQGLTVYPGFIDAAATVFLDESKPPVVEGRSIEVSKYALAGMRTDDHSGLTPDYAAAAHLKMTPNELDKYRQAGFVAVQILPNGRIASGQGTIVNLASLPPREVILSANSFATLHLTERRSSDYPKTKMGAFAHLRQTFLDAERHSKQLRLFHTGDSKIDRPAVDPVLETFTAIRNGNLPTIFLASSRDDIDRALSFAAEHQLRILIWGGDEAYRSTDKLKRTETDLILHVDFGDEPKVDPPKPGDNPYPDIPDPQRVREHKLTEWKRRVAGLAELHRAGVRFAVSSRDGKTPGDVLKSIRQAIANGLDRDAALAALTTDAAKILGLEKELGTITVGRPAYFVVTTGPFENEQTKIRYSIINGNRYEYNKDTKPVEPAKPGEPSPPQTEAKPQPASPVQLGSIETSDTPPAPSTASETVASALNPANADISTVNNGTLSPFATIEQPVEFAEDRYARPVITGGNVLVRNGTVLTATGLTLISTSILVRNGMIAAIGSDIQPDPDMAVIDATGRFVMPGIIDTHSHIMIANGLNEATASIVCEVRIRDVVYTTDSTEYRALAGGVTTARLLHGSANCIGGQDAVVQLKHGTSIADHLLPGAHSGVKFALGENVKSNFGRFPNTRLGIEATLNRAFMEALDYRRIWREFERAKQQAGGVADKLLPPRRDLRLEALADILDHQKFIHSHCYRADEILMLLRVAENHGVRVWSLQHVLEGYKVAPEIVKHGASCSTFADWWTYKIEAYDATPQNAALLHEAGANTVIKSDDWELIRHLYLEAAKTVRYGNMPPDAALQTITLNSAKELGLSDRIGSIEVGKQADLAIFNGHPLNAFSRCEQTLIAGEVFFTRDKQPSAMSDQAALKSAKPLELKLLKPEERVSRIDLDAAKAAKYAIVGATLHPIDADDIPNGVVLIEDGKVATIGQNITIPEGIPVLRADGLHLFPGLIDAGASVGLVEFEQVRVTDDLSELGQFQADLRAGVAVNPDSELFPVARAGGITMSLCLPAGGGNMTYHQRAHGAIIAGQVSIIQLEGWTMPDMVLNMEAGLQLLWPGGPNRKSPIDDLNRHVKEGRLYEKSRTMNSSVTTKATSEPSNPGILIDPRYEALRPYLRGEKSIFIEADKKQEIVEALQFTEQEKLKVVLCGATDAWKVADRIKAANIPVIVGPVMRRPIEDYDPFDAPYANAGRLHEAGVKFCFRSDSASNSRNLPFEAAMAVAYGLPEKEALRAITLSTAEILGVSDRAGSLTPGKWANIVVTDGSPLQQTTQIKGILIQGRPIQPESRQTRFYEKYRTRLKN